MSDHFPKKLIDEAVRFHGHLGPFLVLGLKAGLFANEVLGKDYFRTNTIVETEPTPPCSCFVDGVQFATGCTMGKGNIELRRGSSLSVLFIKDDKRLKLTLKYRILDHLKRIHSKEELKNAALNVSKESTQELFNVEKTTTRVDLGKP